MVRLPPDAGEGSGAALLSERRALRLHVSGVVQGVGFRPFVHRLARRHGLAGWVRNEAGEVQIVVEGPPDELEAFVGALAREAPPLARLERIEREPRAPEGLTDFTIAESADDPDRRQPVPPDVALCPACARELADPANRRYRYPFITCTDCGPRFTVIARLPYDRERTTMQAFTQCRLCEAEYRTPGDRRYHSETNSCPACGPSLWLEVGVSGAVHARGEAALRGAARMLHEGGIVAIRGFGGFHLACDATSEAAVARLRRRKSREAKPFAVMVGSLAEAAALAQLDDREAELLQGQERPIVLLRARVPGPLAPSVAPGLDTVGLLLPATPLHQLLAHEVRRPLVMTSGNRSEEPIAIGNEEARARLGGVADAFLLHDREILSRCDDSVLRVAANGPVFLRRARGYAPLPLRLPVPSPVPLLAVGPHLKNTFTLVHRDTAFVSPHVGDLESRESLEHFRGMLAVYQRLFKVAPQAVVHDRHPGYLSTRLAQELGLGPRLAVQHHHAHITAVLAEHGCDGPAIGVAYDGTGYGDDGAVWGAEILLADFTGFRRLAHLRYAPLPGGDLAARRPWRAALGYLALDRSARSAFALALAPVPPAELALAERQIEAGVNAPPASSMGRLFDAAAAVLGLRHQCRYEGQAAMELEALAGRRPAAELPFPIEPGPDGVWIVDPVPVLARLGHQRQRGVDPADLAADFHASVAWLTQRLVRRAAEATGVSTVALGGGVFQNARLLTSVVDRLTADGFRVLVPRSLSPNDGAISYGQAAVGSAWLAAGVAAQGQAVGGEL
ncbi:MAG TPA: carbamoyltransferase HypF [Gemmatimonadales bacterium]|jgi:hydrogenase maturation protein HypF|nr:carbamoyltransferase HypF [Gemmatimonadales bacterium]